MFKKLLLIFPIVCLGSVKNNLNSIERKELQEPNSFIENKPKKVLLVHGENQAADELRIKIQELYGFECVVPMMGQTFDL